MDISIVKIIYEDNHLIVVNKPAGFLVQKDETGDEILYDYVKEYIRVRYEKPGEAWLGITHRLDRPVSGALIYARTSKALARMNELFQTQKVEKEYWAIVSERPEPLSGKLVHYLAKDEERNITKVLEKPSRKYPKAKLSELTYELIAQLDSRYLLQIFPKTGRSHQIRAQLAQIGCPIDGDLKYGSTAPGPEKNIYLHCRKMEFIHPVKKEPITVIADTPDIGLWKKTKWLQSDTE